MLGKCLHRESKIHFSTLSTVRNGKAGMCVKEELENWKHDSENNSSLK